MAAITAKMVKELKDISGAGMMECKKALSEANGDVDAAIEILRKAGVAMAAKKAGRIAAEGLVAVKLSDDLKKGAIVEVNSETDFVAKNELFINYVNDVASQALATKAATQEEFLADKWLADPSKTVEDVRTEKVGVIHENIQIRRFATLESDGYVASYVHAGGRIGVLVAFDVKEVNDAVKKVGKNIAMQIAGMNPLFLKDSEVPEDFMAKEKEIIMAQIAETAGDKPLAIREKMSIGKLHKRMQEVCLVDQEYFLDDKLTVSKYLQQASKELGFPINVTGFIRWECGEGIEKKKNDFAAEVAEQMNK
jgi:elongation factor Ts